MIEAFKILSEKIDTSIPLILEVVGPDSRTRPRGHKLKIKHQGSTLMTRTNYLAVRVARMWNDLPDSVVEAPSVRAFEGRLERFWRNQTFKYEPSATYEPTEVTRSEVIESDDFSTQG